MKRFLAALGAVLSVASLAVIPLGAETVFTVDSAVESALAHNVSVERNKISYDALRRKSDLSWNSLLPSVQAGAGISKTNESDITTQYGSVSGSLSLSPSIFISMQKASLDWQAGKISRETALRSVELSVRKAFYSLIYEREYVALLEKQIDSAQKQYDQTLAKQKAGLVPEVDALSAEVNLENLKPNLESARTTLSGDLATFKQLIGIDLTADIALEGSLAEALDLKEIDISGISASSASVEKLEKELEAARAQKNLVMAQTWFPTVSLGYAYRPTKSDAAGSEWADAGSVSAAVSISLDSFLPFSSGSENVRSSSDSVKDIELELANERVSDRIERVNLLKSIAQSRSSLKARSLGVALAERNYALTEDAYKRGAKDLLALQSSADSLQEARVAHMQQSFSLISSVLDLENAIGVPFGTLGR